MKTKNPIAKAVKRIRPKVVPGKKKPSKAFLSIKKGLEEAIEWSRGGKKDD